MRLSIIIPIYNVAQYLEQCLQSITAQPVGTGVEVLMVDDGSTDASGAIADSYAARFPYMHVLHKENAGVAAARNSGIAATTGEWLYFVDSDDWLCEDTIASLLDSSREHSDADVILFDAWKEAPKGASPWEHFEKEHVITDRAELQRLQRGMLYYPSAYPDMKVPLAAPWDKLYRREFLMSYGLRFPESLRVLDDMYFNMEVFGQARCVSYVKKKVYHYRYVPDSITNHYKADRVARDCAVWEAIRTYMNGRTDDSQAEREALLQSYYCRVIRSFSICCRLCFFHTMNPHSFSERLAYVREVLDMPPYAEAFAQVQRSEAEWRLRVMISMGRHRFAVGVWLLHVGQSAVIALTQHS